MKWCLHFAVPLMMVAVMVIMGGNLAMEQMTELTGEDYSAVLAVTLEGQESSVQVMGERYAFDGTWLENTAQWLNLAIQSGVDKVQYIAERLRPSS